MSIGQFSSPLGDYISMHGKVKPDVDDVSFYYQIHLLQLQFDFPLAPLKSKADLLEKE
jgi:hypothetical protein